MGISKQEQLDLFAGRMETEEESSDSDDMLGSSAQTLHASQSTSGGYRHADSPSASAQAFSCSCKSDDVLLSEAFGAEDIGPDSSSSDFDISTSDSASSSDISDGDSEWSDDLSDDGGLLSDSSGADNTEPDSFSDIDSSSSDSASSSESSDEESEVIEPVRT